MAFDPTREYPADEVLHLRAAVDGVVSARRRAAAAEVAEARALEAAMAVGERINAASRFSEDHVMTMRAITAELATAARVSERTMERRMAQATTLVRQYPATTAAWERGEISRAHTTVIAEHGATLDDDGRALFEGEVLTRATELSPGRLDAFARRVAEEFQPVPLSERHEIARHRRFVAVTDLADGMSELVAVLPSVLAHAVHDRLTRLGHATIDARGTAGAATTADGTDTPKPGDGGWGGFGPDDTRDGARDAADGHDVTATDERSLDEVRADVFCDLLLTSVPACDTPTGLGAITAVVQVTVPMLTLLHGDDGAELTGRAPIDAATARTIAGGADGWERLLTHPVTDEVLAVDRYRPGPALMRFLRARDEHCRFPGCRRSAHRCDIDHTIAASDGGTTDRTNLAHLCRRHHTMKHATPWRVRQLDGGILEWTTPTGQLLLDRPAAAVRFAPAA